MLKYTDPEILTSMEYQTLFSYTFFNGNNLHKCWMRYLKLAQKADRVVGVPDWKTGEGEINVLGIRNNPEIAFNTVPHKMHNDLLIVTQKVKRSLDIYVFECTMDPSRRKKNVAHQLEGVYASYVAKRAHNWSPGRLAITQDRDDVLVGRTTRAGSLVRIEPYKGRFGINIHDAGGYKNSSLGCTVLTKDSKHNDYHYAKTFKPLLKSVMNKEEVTYAVINIDTATKLASRANYEDLMSTSFNALVVEVLD